jgi:hypothetical protein
MFGGSSNCSGKGWSPSPSDSSSEEYFSHSGMGDKGGILVKLLSSSILSPKFFSSLWVKVGANASPKTDQKCWLGSRIICHPYFAVVPQEEGYPLSFPHYWVITPLTPLSARMMIYIIHRLEGSVHIIYGFPSNMPHIVGQ